MKKLLAIVLSIVMVFSFATLAASAASSNAAEGQVSLTPESIAVNAGDTTDVDVCIDANTVGVYPSEGSLVMLVQIVMEPEFLTVNSVNLSADVKAMGATLSDVEEDASNYFYMATITIPGGAALLNEVKSTPVLTFNITISSAWDSTATPALDIVANAADTFGDGTTYIESADGTITSVDLLSDSGHFSQYVAPPTVWEKLLAKLKEYAVVAIDWVITALTLLRGQLTK